MDNRFNIGTLDTKVTIQTCIITFGTEGGKKYTFQDYRDVYANIDLRANEQVSDGNLEQGEVIDMTIYKIAELTTRWRVKYNGNLYEITGIDAGERISPFFTLTLHYIGAAPQEN